LVDLVARQLSGWGRAGNHDQALATLATLVGSLVLARAVDDPALSKAVRRAGRQQLRQTLGA
jgi:TetR/AcrR family transcriptional regulator, transcriptional repressor for nem operon